MTILLSGCIDENTSLEDLSSAPQAASFSVTTDEDTPVSVQLAVTDRENDPLEYFLEEPPVHGKLEGDHPNLVYRPNANYVGTDQFKYKVSDGTYDSNVATASITIVAVNDPPVISGSPSKLATAYQDYTFTPSVNDIDNGSFLFTVENLPTWMTFSASTGMLSGTPTNEDAGDYDGIILSASDDIDTAYLKAFSISVETNPWVPRAAMPEPASGRAAIHVGGLIYFFGGNHQESYNQVFAYDPQNDSWETKEPLPSGYDIFAAHNINGLIYALSSNGRGREFTKYLHIYDPSDDSWSTGTPIPTNRARFISSVVDGKLYVIGGYLSGYISTSIIEMYDPLTDEWTTKSSAPFFCSEVSGSTLNGKIYIVGCNERLKNAVHIYDPVLEEWENGTSIDGRRYGGTTIVYKNMLYAISNYKNDVFIDVYDPVSYEWTSRTNMTTPRSTRAIVAFGETIYVFGGTKWDIGYLDSVEMYVPNLETK